MKITNKYTYKPLTRVQTDHGRYYEVGESKPLPSVTTILSHTQDNSFLDEWRNKVGIEEATRITEEAAIIGTSLHKNIENYINNDTTRVGNIISKLLSDVIIKKGFKNISEVYGSEVPLYYPGLYAGTADAVALHNGELAILDYKNSRKAKKEEWITSYYGQLSAYAMAHDILYNTQIKKGVIMMAVRDGTYLEFVLDGDKFKQYKDMWLNKVYQYYSDLK